MEFVSLEMTRHGTGVAYRLFVTGKTSLVSACVR